MYNIGDWVRLKTGREEDGGSTGVVVGKGLSNFISVDIYNLNTRKHQQNVYINEMEVVPFEFRERDWTDTFFRYCTTPSFDRTAVLYLIARKDDVENTSEFSCFTGAMNRAVNFFGSGPDSIRVSCTNNFGSSGEEVDFVNIILNPLKDKFSISMDDEEVSLSLPNLHMNVYEMYLILTVFRVVYFYAPHVVKVYELLKEQYPNTNRLFLALISFSVIDFNYYGLESLFQTGDLVSYPEVRFKSPGLAAIVLNHVSLGGLQKTGYWNFDGLGSSMSYVFNQYCSGLNEGIRASGVVERKFPLVEKHYYKYSNVMYLLDKGKVARGEETFFALLDKRAKQYYSLEEDGNE